MKKIKLVASDVDGTLLVEGTPYLNPAYYDVIRELKKQGILFTVASGRQFISVRNVFREIEDEVYFIADNGAHVLKGTETLYCHTMERKVVEDIVAYVRTLPDAFMLFSTPGGAYTDCKNREYIRKNEEGYHVKMVQVEDILTVKEPVIKIALCCETIDAEEMARPASRLFGEVAEVTASGAHWVDFMAKGMDKGKALTKLQERLSISFEETMAFGDNLNDVTMLQNAGESYAVATARAAAKKAARYVLEDTSGDAVLMVLRTLLDQ